MLDLSFNTAIACKITKISPKQLNDWIKKEVIVPSCGSSGGRGKAYLFNFSDLLQIKTAAFLRKSGVSLQKMRRSLAWIRDNLPHVTKPLVELKFFTDGLSVFVLTNNDDDWASQSKALINTNQDGQLFCVFKLGEAAKNLEEDVRVYLHADTKLIKVAGQEYTIHVSPDLEDGGYVTECVELPGCFSQGETKQEAIGSIKSAILDWLGEKESQRIRA